MSRPIIITLLCLSGCLDFRAPTYPPPDVPETTSGPRVLATFPRDGETAVDPNTPITIVFTKPLRTESLVVSIVPAFSFVAPQWELDDTRVVLASTAALDYATAYSVSVSGVDRDGEALDATAFSFVTVAAPVQMAPPVAPTLVSSDPADGATNVANAPEIRVTFSRAMNDAAVVLNPAATLGPGTWNDERTTYTLPATSLLPTQTYTATVTGTSEDGVDLAATSFTFTTETPPDRTAPTIDTRSPAASSTNVPLNANVVIGFSEPMNTGTVTLSVMNGGSPVACATSFDVTRTVLTCDPVSALPGSATLTVTVGPGAQDDAGNMIAGALVHTFATGAAPDTTAPTVQSVTPPSGSDGIAPNAVSLVFAFSEPMNTAGTAQALSVLRQGAVATTGTTTWNPSGTQLTWTPIATPPYGTTLTWSIGSGATDPAGNAITGSPSGTLKLLNQTTVTIKSHGTFDGHMFSGGAGPFTHGVLYAGDYSDNTAVRSFFTFDLNDLLAGLGTFDEGRKARVTFSSATLWLYFSGCVVDGVAGGYDIPPGFGSRLAESIFYDVLDDSDWGLPNDPVPGCTLSFPMNANQEYKKFGRTAANFVTKEYNVAAKVAFDWSQRAARGMRSQWRLRQNVTTDIDGENDYCFWYSGAYTGANATDRHPKLDVTFEYP